MNKWVKPRCLDILVGCKIPSALEIWTRIAPLEASIAQIVKYRIHFCLGHIGIIGQVPILVEQVRGLDQCDISLYY
jgi:hypothetical protein